VGFSKAEAGWRPEVRDLRNLILFCIAYSAAYAYGMSLSSRAGAPFWFPDSVLLCALLLARPRIWWIYILAALPIRLLIPGPVSLPLWFLLVAFANDSLKGLVAASLLRGAVRGRELRFDVLADLWKYLLAAVVIAPAASGLLGAAAWSFLGRDFSTAWRQWALGDAIANLVCTPLLLYAAQDWREFLQAKMPRLIEGLVLFSALPFAAWFAFKSGIGTGGFVDPFGNIPLLLLVWAAVRFGPAGASGALTILSLMSVSATTVGEWGPGGMDLTLSIQLFMVVLAIPILSLSVLVGQQRRTEESLRESEQLFRNMADSAPVLIWISDPSGLATFFNRFWLDFTGRAAEREVGSGWTQDIHPDDREPYIVAYSAAFKHRKRFGTEFRLRRADGEYRWILSSVVPRIAPSGGFAGYVASCVDITELKHAQEEALERQKLESFGVLTSGIGHDFNNLLGSILALADLAAGELAEGAVPREEIHRIRSVAMRGSEIVRELMICSGKDKVSLEPVDVSQLVEDTLELIEVSRSKRGAFQTDLQAKLPLVKGSAPRIRQVVMNLIINASEAIGERDGVIRIATSRVTRSEGDYLKLEVSDNGCGMSEAARARIFDPFFTTKTAGRGMGLAVVQGIVRDHGGAITLVSSPGHGTKFEIFLPCIEGSVSAPSRKEEPAKDLSVQSGTILVVDDEGMLRTALSKMLRKGGLVVYEAADGSAALELLREQRDHIDVMLLDITLPGISSREVFETARRLRPELQIILTSAYGKETVGAVFDGLDVGLFIRKPFQFEDLMDVLQAALSG
jgi:PAS domain S-box-containing protein